MKRIGLYPRVRADTNGAGVVSQSGGVALVETARVAGLDRALSAALALWRKPMARHDPGKVITGSVAVITAPSPPSSRSTFRPETPLDPQSLRGRSVDSDAVSLAGERCGTDTRSWAGSTALSANLV